MPGAQVLRDASGVYYVLGDHLGSASVTLNAAGGVVGELRCYAYGATRLSTGTTPTDRRYTGQRQQVDVGLYYYNARWYDPALARFTSADTIVPEPGNPPALNRYSYVYNSSLNYIDPSGHFTEDAITTYLHSLFPDDPGRVENILEAWKADTEWWKMLMIAESGDVLFGGYGIDTVSGQGYLEGYKGVFQSEGNNELTGISGNFSLLDIQRGRKVQPVQGNYYTVINWIGIFRWINGAPAFHVRNGYRQEVYVTSDAKRRVEHAVLAAGGWLIGYYLPVPEKSRLGTAISAALAVAGWAAPDSFDDWADREEGDHQVRIGPAYFNFQCFFGGCTLERDAYHPGSYGPAFPF